MNAKEEAAEVAQDAAPAHVRVTVNGETRRLPAGTTLAVFLAENNVPARYVAVAVNRQVIRRAAHPDVVLRAGDAVEIVRMVGGGAACAHVKQ